jgi:hypothetical protein
MSLHQCDTVRRGTNLLYLNFDIMNRGRLDFVLIILGDLQNALNPNDRLVGDAFGPQYHVRGYGFAFGHHTLDCLGALPEDQKMDMFAHCPCVMDPGFEDDLPASVFMRKLSDLLRLPFYERGQGHFANNFELELSFQEGTAPDFWFVNGLSP